MDVMTQERGGERKAFVVRLDADLHAALKRHAEERRVSMAVLVSEALSKELRAS